jgi:DNA-directed RNA polymerase specialized sigma24 family protein
MPVRDFAAVYDEHVWQVYGFFAYRLRNRSEAEDLTQFGVRTRPQGVGALRRVAGHRRHAPDGGRAQPAQRSLPGRSQRAQHAIRRRRCRAFARARRRRSCPISASSPDRERALATLSNRERELIALRFGGDLAR